MHWIMPHSLLQHTIRERTAWISAFQAFQPATHGLADLEALVESWYATISARYHLIRRGRPPVPPPFLSSLHLLYVSWFWKVFWALGSMAIQGFLASYLHGYTSGTRQSLTGWWRLYSTIEVWIFSRAGAEGASCIHSHTAHTPSTAYTVEHSLLTAAYFLLACMTVKYCTITIYLLATLLLSYRLSSIDAMYLYGIDCFLCH